VFWFLNPLDKAVKEVCEKLTRSFHCFLAINSNGLVEDSRSILLTWIFEAITSIKLAVVD
jgi:hypothetical protein